MRKRPTQGATSEEVFSLAELTKRVKALERKVALLEGEIRGTGPFLSPFPEEHAQEATIGRKPKLATEEVVRRRDILAPWIELNWPELSKELLSPRNPKFAAYAFVKAKNQRVVVMGIVPFHSNPERFNAELWAFLNSKRFAGNPRNLAGAMAGLPELSWKRSLDIAQKHPIKTPLLPPVWRDHLRRRFPDRFMELRTARTVEDVKAILKRSKSDDVTYRHMREYPEEVLKWVVQAGV